MPDLVYDTSEETLESEVFKLDFLSSSDYSRAPNGPLNEEPIEDSSQSIFMIQKCQEGEKDNPRSEMQQFCQDNGVRRDLSKPGQQ